MINNRAYKINPCNMHHVIESVHVLVKLTGLQLLKCFKIYILTHFKLKKHFKRLVYLNLLNAL